MIDVPVQIRRRMWFQNDGAASHCEISVRDHLDRTLGNRWIGRDGPQDHPIYRLLIFICGVSLRPLPTKRLYILNWTL
ncbi:hypothetical protein CEXT_257231 [Caerostris extrusa]|uniref:Uncharacterized protein n=1 Tax=Caerostris extrusa TaxID=172846 RepID=A0AAV4Q8Y9_CAEEX|nr:hypothetical protein CEXT_257231 [Caerostris extrusa]